MSKRPQESDIEFIKALAGLLRENDLTEIEVNRDYGEDDTLTVRVARQATVIAAPAPQPMAVALTAPQAAATSAVAARRPVRRPGRCPVADGRHRLPAGGARTRRRSSRSATRSPRARPS